MMIALREQNPGHRKIPFLCNQAFTVVELVVVVAAVGLSSAVFVRGQADTMARANRIACVNNLKQLGLALRMWSNDHNGRFPMQLNSDKGGSQEGIDKEQVWLHFMALSNQLSNPKVLVCPADDRRPATTLSNLTATNLSYFVGIDADESIPFMLLAGDRNVTNGMPPKKGILELTDAPPAGWTETIHHDGGNFVFSDGSVQQTSSVGLRRSIAHSNDSNGYGKTRLQVPMAETAR